MADTVYIFGAGINRTLTDWDGHHPPLANDIFQIILKHSRFESDGPYRGNLQPVFDYINRYWKLSVEDLRTQPFDLEACFTLIDQQLREAHEAEDANTARNLIAVYSQLAFALAKLLSLFEREIHTSAEFCRLGEIIFSENAAVLSFNYDICIERAIESASGVSGVMPRSLLEPPYGRDEVSDEELTYSHHRWNLPLAYGFQFDDLKLERAGITATVAGKRFYSCPGNELYVSPVLKLHGSLNWCRQTSQRHIAAYPGTPGATLSENPEAGRTVLLYGDWEMTWLRDWNGWVLDPLIITPQQNKQFYHDIFRPIWKQAHDHLRECRRLIVGGYSFPAADFHVRKLFLEAFSDHAPEEVIVIDPDKRVADLVGTLCHFRKPVWAYRNLVEFVAVADNSNHKWSPAKKHAYLSWHSLRQFMRRQACSVQLMSGLSRQIIHELLNKDGVNWARLRRSVSDSWKYRRESVRRHAAWAARAERAKREQ